MCFWNNSFAFHLAIPDVCNIPTPAGPVPTPLVNLAFSITHIPSVFNVIVGGGLAENLLTTGTVTNGDEAGLAMGVASGMIVGPDRAYLGSFTLFVGAAPASKLLSITGQNGMSPNAVGFTATPGQVCVCVLS